MKIFSFNVRGLGKKEKRKEVRDMIFKNKIEVCCIKESKMEQISKFICLSVWGGHGFDWEFSPSEGNSGGIVIIWNEAVFCKSSSWFMRGMLVVNGFWREDGTRCIIINVYAPCSFPEKCELWDAIKRVIEQNLDACISIVGDFNSIRNEHERVGRGERVDSRDIDCFDEFILQSNLIDLPLIGQKFTYYRPDGTCKSRLDRMLFNEEWIKKWPDLNLRSLGRTISDHCPIFLQSSTKDWGPKPFKFINGWISHPEFASMVKSKWESYIVDRWSSYILKEKLKLLKTDLKVWNKDVFGMLDTSIEVKKAAIDTLDRVDDTFGLEEDEIMERNRLLAELLRKLI